MLLPKRVKYRRVVRGRRIVRANERAGMVNYHKCHKAVQYEV